MAAPIERSTPKRLEEGDYILVTTDRGAPRIATKQRNSKVARLIKPPEKAPHPDPSKRGGYKLTTSLGVIDFVVGVAGVILASAADIKRFERERIEAQRAEREAAGAGSLNGVEMTDAHRAKIPAEPVPSAVRSAGLAATLPPRPSPSQVTAAANRARVPVPTGRAAADNFRAMARASRTERARAFWAARARSAEERVARAV